VSQVDRVRALGLSGLNLQPSFFGVRMTEKRLYPVYARAEELGLPVGLHTGVNYTTHQIIDNDHPRQLDELACAFPNLILIACHAGWPWVNELVAIMRKHPTVLADFGGLAPKYVAESDTGWDVMRRFMNSLLTQQVLFATDWPVFAPGRALAEWRGMGLKAGTLTALLSTNADRLLRCTQASRSTWTANDPATTAMKVNSQQITSTKGERTC
jgi:predicted TIM-barrel fold metal-dependent hydrolase